MPSADQEPDLQIDLGLRFNRTQIRARTYLLGDRAGIARIGLVFPAHAALPCAVDGKSRHVNQSDPGLGTHRLNQTGDATDHVQANPHLTESRQLIDQLSNGGRGVLQTSIELDDALRIDSGHPVDILGDVDADTDVHSCLPRLSKRSAHAVVALHSDRSQSLISGRGGMAPSGDLRPEPSMAASMKTIPTAPPARHHPDSSGCCRQALPSQQPKGRAA